MSSLFNVHVQSPHPIQYRAPVFFPVLSVNQLFFCLFFSVYLQVDFDANIISFCLFSSVYLQVDRPCVVAVGICRRATVVANVLGVQEGQSQPTLLYITWSPSPSSP